MCDVVVWHCKDGYLRHRTLYAVYHARAFVQRREVGIHIARIAFSAGNFALGGAEFAACLGIRGHIGHNDQYMHTQSERQIFRRSQRAARRDYTLYDRVAYKVQIHNDAVHNAGIFERAAEECGDVVFNAHRGEHNRKIVFLTLGCQFCLTHNLRRKLVMLHARAREYRQLLSSDKRRQRVDG